MKKLIAGLAGALCVGLFSTVSQAAPLGGANGAAAAPVGPAVIQVHGLHGACMLDKRGWHRSYVWGRQWCKPPHMHHHHHHHHKKHWKKNWKKKH